MIAQSGKLRVPRGMVSLRQANVGNYMKKIFFTFDFQILPQRRHIGARIISCRYISIKRILNAVGVDTFISIETVSKIVDCGRKIRNDVHHVHIDTYYCKPELMS